MAGKFPTPQEHAMAWLLEAQEIVRKVIEAMQRKATEGGR